MPAPKDPRVLRIRGQLGPAVRDGNTALAAKLSQELDVLRVEKQIRNIAPTLSEAQKAQLASVVFGGAA